MLSALVDRPEDHLIADAELLLMQVIDPVERWLLSVCADECGHWDEIDTAHGVDWFMQFLVAGACAQYATAVIGASLRHEPLPHVARIVAVRLPYDSSDTRALRHRKPTEWELTQTALPQPRLGFRTLHSSSR